MSSRYDEIMKTKPYLPFKLGYLTDSMVEKAREELGETEEVKAKCIPELRKVVEDEKKLVCPTDDEYLLQYLRARKYNVKKAFSLLQNYYQVKKSFSDLYDKFDYETTQKIYQLKGLFCLPYRDEDGCVVYLIQMRKWDPDDFSLGDIIVALTTVILFCVQDTATQICGVRILLDVRGASLKHLRSITPRYMLLFSKALRNCLPVRFKGIHIYNESVIFQYIWSVFKFFLSEKIKKRVHFHGDNAKQLQKFIPKAILPSEYDGNNANFISSDWFNNEVEKFVDRYRELTTYGYRD